MQLNQLLLSLAAPAAVRGVSAAVESVHDVSQNFIDAFTGAPQATPDTSGTAETEPAGFDAKLANFAERLREFLSGNGVQHDYAIQFQIDSTGQPEAGTSGVDGAHAAQLLNQHPEWLAELQQLASEGQFDRVSPLTNRLPGMRVNISQSSSSFWTSL